MKVKRIDRCRICGSKRLKTVVDLGLQTLSGHFPKIGDDDPPLAPLELVQCMDNCGLVQLAHDIPLDMLYGDDYGYLSGLNQTMIKHLESLVKEAKSLFHLWDGDVVIDIGSNDGTLLKSYKMRTIKRIGFDAKHFQKYYQESDIVFIPSFFKRYPFKANIITSIAMFYDLPDPNKFVGTVKSMLASDGIWILEQSYLPSMLSQNAFDTICHEHIEYYSMPQFKYLFEKHGLRVFNAELNDSNGGSIRLYVCHEDADRPIFTDEMEEKIDFVQFDKNIHDVKKRVMGFLWQERKKGKVIHLYGASTKGNVLLQFFGIDYRLVSLAAERNTRKYGCWTPGSHIPIASEELSRGCEPDYYLVLPWHFRRSFVKQMRGYLHDGGQLIFPLPYPEVVSKDGVRPIK